MYVCARFFLVSVCVVYLCVSVSRGVCVCGQKEKVQKASLEAGDRGRVEVAVGAQRQPVGKTPSS